jgi:hypothetical protein
MACPANELLIQNLKKPINSVQGIKLGTDSESCAAHCFNRCDRFIRRMPFDLHETFIDLRKLPLSQALIFEPRDATDG